MDLLNQKLEDLAEMGANDSEYQQMIRHLEQGIQEDQLGEEDSELKKMKGEFQNLGLQYLNRGLLIVKNILISNGARNTILQKLHSTHLGSERMKNIFHGDSSGTESIMT